MKEINATLLIENEKVVINAKLKETVDFDAENVEAVFVFEKDSNIYLKLKEYDFGGSIVPRAEMVIDGKEFYVVAFGSLQDINWEVSFYMIKKETHN